MRVLGRALSALVRFIVLLVFTPAFDIWLSAKLAKVPRVGAWRAFGAFSLCALVTLFAGVLAFVSVFLLLLLHPAYAIVAGLLCLGLWFFGQVVIFRLVLRTDWRKASRVWVLTLVLAVVETVALSLLPTDASPTARDLKARASKMHEVCESQVQTVVKGAKARAQ